MPNYDYQCNDCNERFEFFHSMNGTCEECICCHGSDIKKLITGAYFKITGGTETSANHSYTGRHQDLVKKLHGDKGYREGYRNEIQQQEKIGLKDFKAEQIMQESQMSFEKMKAEGAKMTREEKEAIKKEYGIKKGMKPVSI